MAALQSAAARAARLITIEVGVLAGSAGHAADPKKPGKAKPKKADGGNTSKSKKAPPKKPSHATLAEVASYHEFGEGVQQRSFLRSFSDTRGEEVKTNFRKISLAVLKGLTKQNSRPEVKYNRLGSWIVGQIKLGISANIAPALSDETIARKGSRIALIDTGQLRSSITFRVRDGDSGDTIGGTPGKGPRKTNARRAAKRAGKAALKRARKASNAARKAIVRAGKQSTKAFVKAGTKSVRSALRAGQKSTKSLLSAGKKSLKKYRATRAKANKAKAKSIFKAQRLAQRQVNKAARAAKRKKR